jgi:hypothetical protein
MNREILFSLAKRWFFGHGAVIQGQEMLHPSVHKILTDVDLQEYDARTI